MTHNKAADGAALLKRIVPAWIKRPLRRPWKLLGGKCHRGYCAICECPVYFDIEGPWLRDQYKCAKCGSIPRLRALFTVVNQIYPEWRKLSIHESSPAGSLSAKMARECPAYLASHFFPDAPRGQEHNGFRCEDLLNLTFPDESFDLVITSDVLEHVPNVAVAIREIVRTLKPGGAHIFTVPWFRKNKTLVRAEIRDGTLHHLEKPDYHGNPVSDEGSLVFTEWGRELPFWLQEWGQVPVNIYAIRDRFLGIDGEFLEVFVQQKPPIQ
jgi:hypothetical protein